MKATAAAFTISDISNKEAPRPFEVKTGSFRGEAALGPSLLGICGAPPRCCCRLPPALTGNLSLQLLVNESSGAARAEVNEAWTPTNCSWNTSGLLALSDVSEVRKRHLVSAMCRLTVEEEGRAQHTVQSTGAAALIEVPNRGQTSLFNSFHLFSFLFLFSLQSRATPPELKLRRQALQASAFPSLHALRQSHRRLRRSP